MEHKFQEQLWLNSTSPHQLTFKLNSHPHSVQSHHLLSGHYGSSSRRRQKIAGVRKQASMWPHASKGQRRNLTTKVCQSRLRRRKIHGNAQRHASEKAEGAQTPAPRIAQVTARSWQRSGGSFSEWRLTKTLLKGTYVYILYLHFHWTPHLI